MIQSSTNHYKLPSYLFKFVWSALYTLQKSVYRKQSQSDSLAVGLYIELYTLIDQWKTLFL